MWGRVCASTALLSARHQRYVGRLAGAGRVWKTQAKHPVKPCQCPRACMPTGAAPLPPACLHAHLTTTPSCTCLNTQRTPVTTPPSGPSPVVCACRAHTLLSCKLSLHTFQAPPSLPLPVACARDTHTLHTCCQSCILHTSMPSLRATPTPHATLQLLQDGNTPLHLLVSTACKQYKTLTPDHLAQAIATLRALVGVAPPTTTLPAPAPAAHVDAGEACEYVGCLVRTAWHTPEHAPAIAAHGACAHDSECPSEPQTPLQPTGLQPSHLWHILKHHPAGEQQPAEGGAAAAAAAGGVDPSSPYHVYGLAEASTPWHLNPTGPGDITGAGASTGVDRDVLDAENAAGMTALQVGVTGVRGCVGNCV